MKAAELERLAILAEEMGEAIQIIGKTIRHGYEAYNPFDVKATSNRQLLELELGDVLFAIDLMVNAGDLDLQAIESRRKIKPERVAPYMFHQGEG